MSDEKSSIEFGPGIATTFLYYFTSTAVVLTFVTSRALSIGIDTGLPQRVGALGGLLAGLLGTYFNRTISFAVPVQSSKKFLNELESTLSQLGYELVAEEEDVRIYQRSSLSKWFSGRIFVQLEDQQATIASRAITIRNLKKVLG